ncbi:hypothetical protein BVRB_023750 [Beta vulgaris subsp. vulgaris]|uniref:Sey1/RHD3-like three-helix bundle domain-containing protein n=1 Tax=Beta vulgaris subsp. vulgaris TaxID=3555 RepID=A0A0J8DTT9_BETVV|nr:hypothetical protein BVRB_023750 [Beta vulgaris subsp. vulgaris]
MDSIRESFLNDCQLALEAAETNASRARQLSHIPLWMYALVGILGANEAITVLSHPFLFMLIVFALICLGVIYYLNLSQPALALAKMFLQQASTQMFGALNEYQPVNTAVPKQVPARKRSPAQRRSPVRESGSGFEK